MGQIEPNAPGPVTAPGVLFLVAVPGLEGPLEAEARAFGFDGVTRVAGGVEVRGALSEAARANRELRCAVRVLWRVAQFRAPHLAQLDKRARKVAWRDWLRADVPVKVEAVCRRSKIYVNKAARQRLVGAIEAAGVTVADSAEVVVKLRLEDDLAVVSIDTTGEALHRRGHKTFVGKAPMRETMAAGFLHVLGYDGSQRVVDPMCGSGTHLIEAAEIALGLMPGRSRRFAYQSLVAAPETEGASPRRGYLDPDDREQVRFFGYDRDAGAVRGAIGNAERAGVASLCKFERQAISDLAPPEGAAGIVLVNPPYGGRIGDRKLLFGLYGALGGVLSERFSGWTVGIITGDGGLAKATGLALDAFGPVDHSGTKVQMWHGVI
jgi:putative N6-adenine-specific DNA methylase